MNEWKWVCCGFLDVFWVLWTAAGAGVWEGVGGVREGWGCEGEVLEVGCGCWKDAGWMEGVREK